MYKIGLQLIIIFFPSYLMAQFSYNTNSQYVNPLQDSLCEHHNHNSHKNEVGLAITAAYLKDENSWVPGFHLHYNRNLGASKFGLGANYERLIDEHGHHAIGMALKYTFLHPLSMSLAPGVSFSEIKPFKPEWVIHLEIDYEIHLGIICIGPIIEAAFHKDEVHYSAGLHLGLPF